MLGQRGIRIKWGRGISRRLGVVLLGLGLGIWATSARGELPIDREPIDYHNAPVHDPVARLQERLDRGEVTLRYDDKNGYLASVLEQLGISPTSQMLVFSKTSFQHTRIAPKTPRAVYFGDDAYVGWVRGGDVIEIAAVDPRQGATFYLLDQQKADRPAFIRQTETCLQCHASPKTQDVPGHLVRSVFPDRTGLPVFRAGSFVTSHESPLAERWGGWYVTGTHGEQRHMGNVVVTDPEHPEQLDKDAGANVTDLAGRVDTWPYLTPHSDIVALMVLEHQTQMHNYITLANYQTRLALHSEAAINQALHRPADAISPSTERRIRNAAEKVVKYLLFAHEAPLTSKITGTSDFAREFSARGPFDQRGRSLRQFDLERRLFRYPCSYLIYSEAFDTLPQPAKNHIYRRLREVLTGQDQSPDFAHLSSEDRRAILEILLATKPGLPDDWKTP
ncbi:MAG: hypothetical protein IRY99_25280 [Isosphaeraceae bacterium]|nr:hypothetical protein [Isosphaeraceae bacterium]